MLADLTTAFAKAIVIVATLLGTAVAQEASLDELITQLRATDARDRAMAACRIGRLRGSDVTAARDGLIALLGDDVPVEPQLCRPDGDYRWGRRDNSSPAREAAMALERVGTAAIERLFDVLAGDDAIAREHAALALGLIENERALAPLADALGDAVAAVRGRAAWALGMIESSAAVEGLIEALGDEQASVREQVAWALGMIEDGRAVGALTDALEDDDAKVRRQVLWALVRCIENSDADVDYGELAEKLRSALRRGGEIFHP